MKDAMSLKDKVLFISGGSRGIGFAIAARAARDGARVAIAAKTVEPHRYLPGTIHTAAEEIEKLGGKALPLVMDVRSEDSVAAAVAQTVKTFGGIDICINNASAINLSDTQGVTMKQFDLMTSINVRGTFMTSKLCLPHLLKAQNPHVLTMAPPLDLSARWFAPHAAYSIAKFGMSLTVLAMAEEFRERGVAFNALWPRTPIATAAIEFGVPNGRELVAQCRKPEIMADAAHCVLTQRAREFTGRFCIDDSVLFDLGGVRDFEVYRVSTDQKLATDLFVSRDTPMPPTVAASMA
jgi:citronellol/citronellal dehydrogenase